MSAFRSSRTVAGDPTAEKPSHVPHQPADGVQRPFSGPAAAAVRRPPSGDSPRLLKRGEEARCFRVRVGSDHVHTNHSVRPLEQGLKWRRIDVERRHQVVGREVRREREWQPELRGKLGAEKAGAEHPIGTVSPAPGTARTGCPAAPVQVG